MMLTKHKACRKPFRGLRGILFVLLRRNRIMNVEEEKEGEESFDQ